MRWQKVARLVIAAAAVVFAVVVVLGLKRRSPPPAPAPTVRADPGAIVEVTGGRVERFKLSREDVRVDYERQLTYANGSTKLVGVTITTDQRDGGRSFTAKGKEGDVGQNETTIHLNGDVRLAASDGMTVRTEHASYSDQDRIVRAAGPVDFSRGKMTGSGVGMTYDTAADVLVILDQALVHVAPDAHGAGAAEIASGTARFARREHEIRFEGAVKLQRAGQIIVSDLAVAHLTSDERQIDSMELRNRSRIAMVKPPAGGLQALNSRDMDVKYGADGQAIEHAVLMGDAAIVLAGASGAPGRQIMGKTIDVTLAPDGTTPVALVGRDAVQLLLPAEGDLPTRTIKAANMRAEGQPGRGLTRAEFAGAVEYSERGPAVNRTASASMLDVALKPAMAGIDEATFTHDVHFVDGKMTSVAAAARYDLAKGLLALSGSDPGAARPHVVNDQIVVDATRIDVTLAGPNMKATEAVKSVLQAAKGGRDGNASSGTHLPSMFKQDRPVNVTADALDYNGTASIAAYTGNARLWQDETSVKGASILINNKTGDLTADGGVATVTVRDDVDKNKKPVRVRSVATSADFKYDDGPHRATYTGKAHMNSSDGDITASKIELHLKPAGDELDRAEAFDGVTLHDQNRTTTGSHLTYTTADQRYVVTGAPVKVLDECRRETIGKTLTYLKSSETITIDGNEQTRTQTKGNGQCP